MQYTLTTARQFDGFAGRIVILKLALLQKPLGESDFLHGSALFRFLLLVVLDGSGIDA
jgi:hypothetical protein